MINTLENIFRIPDLRKKILYTIGLLLVFRIGTFIPLPGLDLSVLNELFASGKGEGGAGIVDFVNMFSGGAFKQMSIMALGIMPYISASIILQLLTVVIPHLEKLSKEGEEGRKKITQYTRIGTVLLCMGQSIGIALWLLGNNPEDGNPLVLIASKPLFVFLTMVTMAAGTTFLMWLGEKISEYGIGNGISMIIMGGIVARFPDAIIELAKNMQQGDMQIFGLVFIALAMFGVIYAIALMTQAQRKIPIQHAKKVVGRRVYAAQTSYLPIRLTTAGVIPIIFASSLLMFPYTLGGLIGKGDEASLFSTIAAWITPNSQYNLYQFISMFIDKLGESINSTVPETIWAASPFKLLSGFTLYNFLFAVLIVVFSFFYTAIIFNPSDIADNLKKSGAFIPGIRAGKHTSQYLEFVLHRITFAGAIFLAMVALVPSFGTSAFNIPYITSSFLGGTGMLICVGVGLDLIQQIESHLHMHNYEGFSKKRIKGRR